MTQKHNITGSHPTDIALADYLDNLLSPENRERIEAHVAACGECRGKIVCAYESGRSFRNDISNGKRKGKPMGRINLYLIFAILSFALSFTFPRFFLQLLVATLLLGAKWITDSKTTKMLVMIHEAWKSGGEHEASEVIRRFDRKINSRL